MATLACRVCGEAGPRPFYRQGRRAQFVFRRCGMCGLVMYDLEHGLDQDKYAGDLADPRDGHARGNRGASASFRFLTRHVGPPGRLLDIGCGNGRLLHLAHEAGWSVRGLELSEELANRVQEATRLPVDAGDFLHDAHLETWDVVVLRHVLEHLPDPLDALGRVRDRLVPGGWGLLEFPNIDGWDLRVKRLLERAHLRTKRYPEAYVPGHCNEFCRSSFRAAVDRVGLHLVRWETYSHRPLADAVYRHVHVGNKARALVRRAGGSR